MHDRVPSRSHSVVPSFVMKKLELHCEVKKDHVAHCRSVPVGPDAVPLRQTLLLEHHPQNEDAAWQE